MDRDMLELEFLREQRKMRIFTQRTSGPIENMIAYCVVLSHAAYAPSHARLGYNRLSVPPACRNRNTKNMGHPKMTHTRDALASAKARGVVLGATGPANLKRHTQQRQAAASAFNARLMPLLNGFASQGLSRRAIVIQLNDLGITAPRGGA